MPHGLKRPDTANPEENTDRFHHMFMVGRRLTINQQANANSTSIVKVENIPQSELHMTKISDRWLARLLTFDQKYIRETSR